MIGTENDNKKWYKQTYQCKKDTLNNKLLCSAKYHNYLFVCIYHCLILFLFPKLRTLAHWPVFTLFLYVTQNLSPEQIPGKSLLMVPSLSGNSSFRQVSASETSYQHIGLLHIAKLKGQTSPTTITTTR